NKPEIILSNKDRVFQSLTFFCLHLTDAECVKHRQQVDCSKYKKSPPEERVCYDLYAPICGSDGKTYSNECYFCYEVEKTKNKLKFAHFGKC
uniref:Kazal-like domain-containing protein n=1 Tax=Sus scrofa TaxID=9823 RepID=A0A8D0MUB5_PIG